MKKMREKLLKEEVDLLRGSTNKKDDSPVKERKSNRDRDDSDDEYNVTDTYLLTYLLTHLFTY